LFKDEAGTTELNETEVKIPVLGHTHAPELVEANDATCTETGNTAYYKCGGCGKLFDGEDGSNEVFEADITSAKTAHELSKTEAVAATETTAGTVAYWTCSNCNKRFSDGNGNTEITDIELAPLGHTMTYTAAEEATTTETGRKEYWK
jgi:hypothetical protein